MDPQDTSTRHEPDSSPHWLNRQRLHRYPQIFLCLYAAMTAVLFLTAHGGLEYSGKPIGHDFITFWTASRLGLSGDPAAAYDVDTIVRAQQELVPGLQTFNPWLYPPTFFLLVLPLSLMPYLLSYLVFESATLLLLAGVVRRIVAVRGSWLVLLAFPGLYVNFSEGQTGYLTAALFGCALLLLRTRPVVAGILVGLLTIKPHLGLLFPIALVAGRCWKTLLAATLTAALFLGLSLAVLDQGCLRGFVANLGLPHWLLQHTQLAVKVPTFFSFAYELGSPEWLAYLVQAAVAVPVAMAVYWAWRRPVDFDLRAATLSSGSLLISPYLLHYDLVWLALPLSWIAADGLRRGWLRGDREILLACWLLPILIVPLAALLHAQLAPIALLLLFLCIMRRICQASGEPQFDQATPSA